MLTRIVELDLSANGSHACMPVVGIAPYCCCSPCHCPLQICKMTDIDPLPGITGTHECKTFDLDKLLSLAAADAVAHLL